MYANINNISKFELNPLDNKKKDISLNVLFRTFSRHFRSIFRSNYFHIKKNLDNKKDISLNVLFRTFQVNFQDISVTCVIFTSYDDKKNLMTIMLCP